VALKLTNLRPQARPEPAAEKLSGHSKTRKLTKRRRRRNARQRDELKQRGRHRGFSHGKA
jgi:hypothetical protein